jgi:hypothetical protein
LLQCRVVRRVGAWIRLARAVEAFVSTKNLVGIVEAEDILRITIISAFVPRRLTLVESDIGSHHASTTVVQQGTGWNSSKCPTIKTSRRMNGGLQLRRDGGMEVGLGKGKAACTPPVNLSAKRSIQPLKGTFG